MKNIILAIIAGFTMVFCINSGIVFCLCWLLRVAGITSIDGWNVHFSIPLVILLTVFTTFINVSFKKKD